MIVKLIKHLKHDKNKNKDKNIPDNLHGEIILEVIEMGIVIAPVEALYNLLLDDNEIKYTGWDKYKNKFISDGIITELDIENEKKKPEAFKILNALKNKLNIQ